MNPDFLLMIYSVIMVGCGYVLGRLERKDSYAKTYKYGFEVGKRVGARDASK